MTKHFTQTSDLPYDKHDYKFVYADGSYKIFDCYEEAQMEWFQSPLETLGLIEVVDKKVSKGFK